MTTDTTTTAAATPATTESRTTALRGLTALGGIATIASTFMSWTYTDKFPGDLTVYGYPGGLQVLTLTAGILVLLYAVAALGIRGTRWIAPTGTTRALQLLALGAFGTTWFTVIAITVELGGVVNLEPGGFVAAVASAIPLAAFLLPDDTHKAARPKELPSWAEILIIVAAFGTGLFVVTYGIDTEYAELFTGYMITAGFAVGALFKSGLMARLSALTTKYRSIAVAAAFVAAAAFPFTQSTDQFTLIAVNILIFATVALGLNIVVGLAGLLDLGYVAFLGVGAYTAALVSGTTASAFDVHFPFWAAVLTGAAVSSSSASSSAPPPSASAATTSPSSPSASARSSASPSATSTASPDPRSPTAPTAYPTSPTSSSSDTTSANPTPSSASNSADTPTTTYSCSSR